MMAMKRNISGESNAAAATKEEREKEEDPVKKMRYGDNRRTDKGVPIACDCGAAVSVATCNSPNGRDKRYFLCGYDLRNDASEGCGFKRAVEKAMLEEFAIIKGEKVELQERLDAANKMSDEDKGTLVWMQFQYEEIMFDHKRVEDESGKLFGTQLGLTEVKDMQSALERKVGSLEKNLDMERVMLRRYGEVQTKDKGVPRGCDCGHSVIVEIEKEALNRGIKYLSCPYGVVDGCGFNWWWVQAILEEFELIKDEKEAMSKSLEESKEKNEDLEDRDQAGEDDGTLEHNVADVNRKLALLTEKFDDLARNTSGWRAST